MSPTSRAGSKEYDEEESKRSAYTMSHKRYISQVPIANIAIFVSHRGSSIVDLRSHLPYLIRYSTHSELGHDENLIEKDVFLKIYSFIYRIHLRI